MRQVPVQRPQPVHGPGLLDSLNVVHGSASHRYLEFPGANGTQRLLNEDSRGELGELWDNLRDFLNSGKSPESMAKEF